jgi:hypothetical protein
MDATLKPASRARSGHTLLYVVVALFVVLFLVGIAEDPAEYWNSISRFPSAFASAATWLVLTLGFVFLVVDTACRIFVHKSLSYFSSFSGGHNS